jgi:hypothetical protein
MANNEMFYREEDVYKECLTWHALQWMKDYGHLNSVWYLENNAGPVLGYFINKYGISKVLEELDRKIQELVK